MSALTTFFASLAGATAGAAPEKKPSLSERADKFTDDQIDEIIGDPQERLVELAKYKVPRFSDEYKDDTPAIRFLKDMESGSEKANEYIKCINETLKHVDEYSSLAGLENVAKAANGIKTVTSKLESSLGTAGEIITKARQAVEWVHAMDKFADDTVAMGKHPTDRQSVQGWVGSMKRLHDATAPFAEWAQNKAAVAAIAEGSAAAGAFCLSMAVVGAYVEVGIGALEAGVTVVSRYLDRLDSLMKEIDRGETGQAAPPPPACPDDWISREDKAKQAVARENYELKSRIKQAQVLASQKAEGDFDNDVFPEIYMAKDGPRPEIRRKIRAAMDAADTANGPEYDWWYCLTGVDSYGMSDDTVSETAATLDNIEDARQEIKNFKALSPPGCKFFKSVYDAEYKKYAGQGKSP